MTTPATIRSQGTVRRLFDAAIDRSLLLVAGAVAGLAWANTAPASYAHASHALLFPVNDIGMVFFFGLATGEIVNAMRPGGVLSSRRAAAMPLVAAVGGMLVPALLYGLMTVGSAHTELLPGWAIPCATDIAFSYMAARAIFGPSHPAIPFLLFLAIADDALGLVILAVAYPARQVSMLAFVLWLIPALFTGWLLRRARVASAWPYLTSAGTLAWLGFYFGGLHPALALVPVVPFMAGAAGAERPDTLTTFDRLWRAPVQFVLFFFGLVNAGVPFSGVGIGTWVVVAALVVGKPAGIALATALAEVAGLRRPAGLLARDVLVIGVAAGIGFTVSLFFATAAFPEGALLAETKMGALFSFAAAPLALVVARLLRISRAAAPEAVSASGRP
jgi:NhaA family Na+:H+ antiporter